MYILFFEDNVMPDFEEYIDLKYSCSERLHAPITTSNARKSKCDYFIETIVPVFVDL